MCGHGGSGWSGHDATQLHYDPFAHPRRAERQEFEDALAEGLYALLTWTKGRRMLTVLTGLISLTRSAGFSAIYSSVLIRRRGGRAIE